MIIVRDIHVGARLFDTTATITASTARALKDEGYDGAIRYLGGMSRDERDHILDEGLGIVPVTYSRKPGWVPTQAMGVADGVRSVEQLDAIGLLLPNLNAYLDLEGCAGPADPAAAWADAWAEKIDAAKLVAGLYVGAQDVLNSVQLYKLRVTRYWNSMSDERDLKGELAEPLCGYVLTQLFPTITTRSGVSVDVDFAGHDWRGRSATWAVRG